MKGRAAIRAWLIVLGVIAGAAPACAGQASESKASGKPAAVPASATRKEDSSKATGKTSSLAKAAHGTAKVTPGKVYTNEDLDKLRGEATPLPAEPPAPTEPVLTIAPEQAPAAAELTAEDRVAKIAALEKKITELTERIPALQKRMAAIRNPFLAPPKPPDKDREQWDKMDNVQRLQRSETELADTHKELEAAQRELSELRQAS